MKVRQRKLIGAVLLIALVIVWALLAMVLAQTLAVHGSAWVAAAYYVIAGLGWVLPAMPLIKWMQKP